MFLKNRVLASNIKGLRKKLCKALTQIFHRMAPNTAPISIKSVQLAFKMFLSSDQRM